jgi:hypothetical protein
MSQLDLETPFQYPALPQVWYGIVTDPPTRSNGKIGVSIPDMNPDQTFKSSRWQTRDSQALPQAGDEVLCAFDNRNDLWVINWWPSGNTPGITTSNYVDGPPVSAADDHIWSAMNVNATCKRLMFQYDQPTDTWIKEDLVPLPIVNNQWLKGSGGAVVWSGITEDTAWQPLTLNSPFANYGGSFNTCAYRKLASGLVVLKGLVNCTTATVANATVFTLPVGYRPAATALGGLFGYTGSYGVFRFDLASTGSCFLTPALTINSWFSLEQIRFYADQ